MRIVDVLDHGLAGVENVCVRHMVEEQEQVIRRGRHRFVEVLHFRRILADESRPGSHCAVHADAVMVCAMPLPPAILLRRRDSRSVMASQNVGKRSGSERSRVALVRVPGR